MPDTAAATPSTAWRVAYWLLTASFIVTAVISMQRIRAGFLSSYAADLTCPAWLYVSIRSLHGAPSTAVRRTVGATPERAALVLFGGSVLTELSQIRWPNGFFAGTYDPWDIAAYATGVGVCYVCERVSRRDSPSESGSAR